MARDALSPAMLAALDHARAHGGELSRYPGGFWSHADWKGSRSGEIWFGESTVNALIARKRVEVSEWKRGAIASFPIRVRVVEP